MPEHDTTSPQMGTGPGSCFNCGDTVDSDYYCHGCHEYVCGRCEAGYSVAAATLGPHKPADHLKEHEESAEDSTDDSDDPLSAAGREADPWATED
jgi:hypothetical protein